VSKAKSGTIADPAKDDPFMTYAEVGRRCGKSPQTISRLVAEGVVKAAYLPSNGGTRLMGIRTSEALKLLQRLEEVKNS
jgi:hypothetical protein